MAALRVRRAFALTVIASAFLARPRVASAHTVGQSQGVYSVDHGLVKADISLARSELLIAIDGLDLDHDGILEQPELEAGQSKLATAIIDRVRIVADHGPCLGKLEQASMSAQDGVELRASFDCGEPITLVTIDTDFVDDLPSGHRHVARIDGGTAPTEEVLYRGKKRISVTVAPSKGGQADPTRRGQSGFARGIAGALGRIEHLIFAAGLAFADPERAAPARTIAAFVIGCTLAFVLGAFRVWAPSASFLTVPLALSVLYLGVDNLAAQDRFPRWPPTFALGLVHGFGLAGLVSQDEGGSIGTSATIGVGVSAVGALTGVAVVSAVLLSLSRRNARASIWVPRVGSIAITITGVLFLARSLLHARH